MHQATDLIEEREVVLKFMRNRGEFSREIEARSGDRRLPADVVVEVLSCHVPEDQEPSEAWAHLLRRERADAASSHPYLLVMYRGGESLHQFLSS